MLWTGPRREVCLFSILMTPSRVALPAIDCHPFSGLPLFRGKEENEPRITLIYTDKKSHSFPSVFIREIRG
jgi:hypothetical protein